ncbi:hypothetical protein A9K55_009354 [Cordyceps militaris]|uniref:Uncharacterized protein n=1 Tax=Cordyceps militaris TaxID=73501 RepID=A0A2H4SIQ3_CORMI|nr:hypothetical protein A9K55_009354 [Cordyceps militaris]
MRSTTTTTDQLLFDVPLEDTQPPPYEKQERLPPSYHDIKRADRHAATGLRGWLRRRFSVERRFETVTLGRVLSSAAATTTRASL